MPSETDIPLKELQAIAAFPIERAWVCPACKTVANIPKCPYCLGESVASLSTWLNRGVAKPMCETATPQCGVVLTSDHEPRLSTYCMRPRGHEGKHSPERLKEDILANYGPYTDERAKRGF